MGRRRRPRGAEITLRPRQLVLALGASGLPIVPEIPGREKFRGDQHHSSAHPGPDRYKGKKAVVIGSNNSAHDICAALWEAGSTSPWCSAAQPISCGPTR